jgi:hypothetical protein
MIKYNSPLLPLPAPPETAEELNSLCEMSFLRFCEKINSALFSHPENSGLHFRSNTFITEGTEG